MWSTKLHAKTATLHMSAKRGENLVVIRVKEHEYKISGNPFKYTGTN